MTEKQFMRHLHMGCGESLQAAFSNTSQSKKNAGKDLRKQNRNKTTKQAQSV